MTTFNLEKLIEKCKSKELKAQGELYQRYKDRLFVLSLKYCTNREEAQDNLHDSFLDIYKSIKKYKGKGSFEGRMKRIVIYKAIDRYKKEVFSTPINDDLFLDKATTIEEPTNDISLDTILHSIQSLPPKYRLVFNLYELDDYSHKEIATLLSISVGTSKSNLHRAKLLLKERITDIQKPVSNEN
ncbi:MAG: sigma-70 family RNA polymerase sigma factor [Flavobacteriaceae bacterium]|nr:sigma-70 family RNA polymerase sigma factor [Flavobacteriaceae bacterium]